MRATWQLGGLSEGTVQQQPGVGPGCKVVGCVGDGHCELGAEQEGDL